MPAQGGARHAPGDDAGVELVHLRKEFGDVVAVDSVDLVIRHGEFFSMLGPSGSGKTTVLRMIAGFEMPTAGAVLLEGRDVSHLAPYDRDVNTVFQDYALFPHMDVGQNVEYGLRVKGVGRAERRRRATEALASVRLADFQRRRPNQLSGGQRQRVALARALVNRPKVLLLDEPLGALDLKLREEMQVELKAIQHEVGITFVFVTHDQHEALSMSDRVAVFNRGHIEQVGTPREIYEHPATAFVAGFVGTTNLLSGEVAHAVLGDDVVATIRPERIRMVAPNATVPDDAPRSGGTVTEVLYLGAETRFVVGLDGGGRIIVSRPNTSDHRDAAPGSAVLLSWREDDIRIIAGSPADVVPEPDADTDVGDADGSPSIPTTTPATTRGTR
jgi:putative spermidine/putrescine transport system ATP-binding protein